MIRLSQSWVLYLLIFGIVPLLLSVRSYVWGREGYAFLNRTNIEVVKGFSMLLIIFQSLCDRLVNQNLFTISISRSGILGVTLFLFICGYEAMTQYMNNRRYLRGFIFHQVIRIVCVFLVCNFLGALVNISMGGHDSLKGMLYQTVSFHFSDRTSAWLIGTLLYFYIAFYLSYRTKFKMNLLLSFSVIYIGISLAARWNFSIAFCFLVGVFVAKYKKYLFRLIREYLLGLFIGSLVSFSGIYLLYLKGFTFISPLVPYVFLILVLCILMKLQCRSRVFAMIGYAATELYLVHEVLLILVLGYSETRSGGFLVLFLILAMVGALLLKNVSCRMFLVPKQYHVQK